jgi:glycosyltransferase involved in cell wall biosynthesis
MAPKVSVLMATYNMASYLPTAIESVLSQDFENFELLIGDNLSTDQTSEIGHHYSHIDPRVKYHRNARHVTAGENFGLCLDRADAESSYWIMLASDDWWKPNLLSQLLAVLEEDQTITFVHCDATLTDADGNPTSTKYSELWGNMAHPQHGPHFGIEALFQGCYVMALATLVNREQKDCIYPVRPLMDPSLKLAPDHNLWLQLMVRGAKAFYYDEPLAFYRKHQDAMTMPWNEHARLYEEIEIFSDKLAGVCPPDIEPLRIQALRNRYAQLGFDCLVLQEPAKAAEFLRKANRVGGNRRLDVSVARLVSALPLPASTRAGIWNQALRANAALGRVQ